MEEDIQAKTIENLVVNREGDRIRRLVRNITEAYKKSGDIGELEQTARDKEAHELIRGLASSASYMIRGDREVLKQCEYGGLGITLYKQDPVIMSFKDRQMWFAELKNDSARYAKFYDFSGWFSLFTENAGKSLSAKDASLWYSTIMNSALTKAKLGGESLSFATIQNSSLYEAEVRENAGFEVTATGSAGQGTRNIENAFSFSNVSDYAFDYSVNADWAFRGANITKHPFRRSNNRNHSFFGARINTDTAFDGAYGKPVSMQESLSNEQGEEQTLEQVAAKVKVTRQGISAIERAGIKKLREKLVRAMRQEKIYEHMTPFEVEQDISSVFYTALQNSSNGEKFDLANIGQHIKPENIPFITYFRPYSTDERLYTHRLGGASEQANLVSWSQEKFTTRILWALRNGIISAEN